MTDEVLPNRLGITDAAELHAFEQRASTLRVREIAIEPYRFGGDFDFPHLQRLHAHILGDVYEWAGRPRTEETGAMGMAHCRVEFLPEQIRYTFSRIADALPLPGDVDAAVELVADLWGDTTALHPFRDGNSRSQTVFFDLMLTDAGHRVDWNRVDAAAVHAARHVAMLTTDSSYLAAEIRPGVLDDARPASVSSAISRDNRRAAQLYEAMREHRASGTGSAADYQRERTARERQAAAARKTKTTADRAARSMRGHPRPEPPAPGGPAI